MLEPDSLMERQTKIRRMEPPDLPAFVELVEALADYEHLAPPDSAARRRLERDAFSRPPRFSVLLAETAGRIVGYAIYFYTYSSFLAQPTLYLEDIFVLLDDRGSGTGRALMQALAREAIIADCGRMEWQVLDWNTPSQAFYQRLGARRLMEWQSYRVTGEALRALAEDVPATP
jgi:GNAT superfamily N-acetyltransferase